MIVSYKPKNVKNKRYYIYGNRPLPTKTSNSAKRLGHRKKIGRQPFYTSFAQARRVERDQVPLRKRGRKPKK